MYDPRWEVAKMIGRLWCGICNDIYVGGVVLIVQTVLQGR